MGTVPADAGRSTQQGAVDQVDGDASRPGVDLSTTYMGLSLRTPLVASSGPLTGRLEPLEALERNGISAVVLPSLFEEQVVHEEMESIGLFERGVGSNPEATSYFPDLVGYETVGERYLRHLRDAKKTLSVPVIGSLNGVSTGGWTRYARMIADAGADALELNLYDVVIDLSATAEDVERRQLELVEQVKQSIDIPLAVKLSPYYTAFGHTATRMVDAGADALVLFNRFYQPDIDPETLETSLTLELSTSSELRLPLRWTAVLAGRVAADLAVTGGVHTGLDAARCLLAGADVAMMTSALLRSGPTHVEAVERELTEWADEQQYESVGQLRSSMSYHHVADPTAYERGNYIGTLTRYSNTFHDVQGFGPW
jgi:dihydroorotate dehydrogenase (fumarate)